MMARKRARKTDEMVKTLQSSTNMYYIHNTHKEWKLA